MGPSVNIEDIIEVIPFLGALLCSLGIVSLFERVSMLVD